MFNDEGFNPEGSIIRKFHIFLRFKFLYRLNQAKIAFLNQVKQVLHPEITVVHRYLNDQSEVRRHQLLSGRFVTRAINLFEQGKFLVEDLDCGACARIKKGDMLVIMPLKLRGVSGAPCRVVALG